MSSVVFLRVIAVTCFTFVLCGCATRIAQPNLGEIYTARAQHHGPETTPVVVIPGILGSRLVDDTSGSVVWGAFGGMGISPARDEGLRAVSLPMRRGTPLAQLRDSVRPDGALDRVTLRAFPAIDVSLKAYAYLLATLGAGGFRDEQLAEANVIDYGTDHYTCFQFGYDWRRSCAENAAELERFLIEKKAEVEAKNRTLYGYTKPVRFNLVAHSMGGMVARYMIRYGSQPLGEAGPMPRLNWSGARLVENLVIVATPNAGSLDALVKLTEGFRPAPILPKYPAEALGTMPAVYELLPRPRHRVVLDENGAAVDFMKAEVWERYGWGLASPDADRVLERMLPDIEDNDERRRIARDQLEKSLAVARRFHEAIDRPVSKSPIRIHLYAGDATPTLAQVRATRGGVTPLRWVPGDGTVARYYSAIMDEREGTSRYDTGPRSPIPWHATHFIFDNHLGITKDPGFSDSVLYLLLEAG